MKRARKKEIKPTKERNTDAQEFTIDLRLQDFERKILDRFQLIRDQILTSNDKVVKELDDIRINYQIFEGISEQTRDKVENHEKRITELEKN